MNRSSNSSITRRGWVTQVLATAAFTVALPKLLAAVKPGDAFPNFSQFGLEGTLPDLSGKVVLVDLWASWCGPCKKAFPVLKELHEKFASQGLVIVAVSLDEDKKNMDAFLKKNPVPFTIMRDPKAAMADTLGVEGIPTSFVLSPGGKIHAVHTGFEGDSTRKKYIEEISSLLKK